MQNRYFDDPNLLAMRPMLVMKSFFFLSLSTSENSLHFNFSSLVTKKDKKDFFLVGEGSEALSHIYFSLNGSISIYFHLPLPIFAFLVSRVLAPTHNFWRERLRKKMQIPFSRNENFFFVHPFWRWIAHLVQNVHTAKSRRCAEKKTFHHKDRPEIRAVGRASASSMHPKPKQPSSI